MSRRRIYTILYYGFCFLLLSGCEKKNDNEIKLGFLLPLSGQAASYGRSMQNAIELNLKRTPNIRGRKVLAYYEDDKGDPTTALSAVMKLVEVDKVVAVLGGATSSVTMAVAPFMERSKIVFLTPASSSPKITHAGDYIFRSCTSDLYDGRVTAQYVFDSLAIKRVSLLCVNDEFGRGLQMVFSAEFTKLGGEISAVENFEKQTVNFRPQLTKLMASGSGAIFLVGFKEVGLLLRQARELNMKQEFVSVGIIENPDVISTAGNAIDGLVFSSPSYDPSSGDSLVSKFVEEYKSSFGATPDLYAAYTYDATNILLVALDQMISREIDLKSSLYSIKGFRGVTGITSFDLNGDVVKSYGIKEFKGGIIQWRVRNLPVNQ